MSPRIVAAASAKAAGSTSACSSMARIAEVVLPGRERPIGDERGDARHRRRLPRDDHRLSAEAGGVEEGVPVETRRIAREVGPRPLVVGVAIDRRGVARRVRPGDGNLEREHRGCARFGAIEAGERQQAGDVLLVAPPPLDGAGLLAQIGAAVAEGQAALHQERGVVRLAVDAVGHRQAEHRRRRVGADVERIDVGAHGAAEQARQGEPVADAVDPGEQRRERRQARPLDCRSIRAPPRESRPPRGPGCPLAPRPRRRGWPRPGAASAR